MDMHKSSAALMRRQEQIKTNPNFLAAIKEHYRINCEIYKKQPLFYKTLLQESRLNIVLSVCCFVFGHQASSVSDIKELCSRYRIASPNSIIAIITLLKTTNRIRIWRSESDRRKVLIEPTPKGLDELKRYMTGGFTPVTLLYPGYTIPEDLFENENLRHNFFRRAAEYLFQGVTFKKILPKVELFIDKDGGRMIMLYLYLKAIERLTSRGALIEFSANQLAKEFSVSRIHVSRMIKSAQQAGYLYDREDGFIAIYPGFIKLVENYSAFYFAYLSHYLNINTYAK